MLTCHHSNWMQMEIFFPNDLNIFRVIQKSSVDEPLLLIFENHSTQKHCTALGSARQNIDHTHMPYIPYISPSSALRRIYVSFSTFYMLEWEAWTKQHLGRTVSILEGCTIIRNFFLPHKVPLMVLRKQNWMGHEYISRRGIGPVKQSRHDW